MLPFCLALVDMLQAQNPLAALPAALGILSGTRWRFGPIHCLALA